MENIAIFQTPLNKKTNLTSICVQSGTLGTTNSVCGAANDAACTVTGSAQFDEFAGVTKYNVLLQGTGITTNTVYNVEVVATCATATTAASRLVQITSPFLMFNGFRVSGVTTNGHSIAGTKPVKAQFLAIYDNAATPVLIGCTDVAMT